MLLPRTMIGASFGGHSAGFHVGSYRNESFPEALRKVDQPAVGSGVEAIGDAVADGQVEARGVEVAGGPTADGALVPQAAAPAPRRTKTPARTMVRVRVGVLISTGVPVLAEPSSARCWGNRAFLNRVTRLPRRAAKAWSDARRPDHARPCNVAASIEPEPTMRSSGSNGNVARTLDDEMTRMSAPHRCRRLRRRIASPPRNRPIPAALKPARRQPSTQRWLPTRKTHQVPPARTRRSRDTMHPGRPPRTHQPQGRDHVARALQGE